MKKNKMKRYVPGHAVSIGIALVGVLSVGVPYVSAQEERLSLVLDGPSPHAFSYSRLDYGTLYVSSCRDEAGREYGAILVWRTAKSGELIDVGTVSSLDKVLRAHVDLLGAKPERKRIMNIVAPAIGEYAQLTTGGCVLYTTEFQSFLAQMKEHVSVDVYDTLSKRLVYPSETILGDSWTMPIFLLKADGAMELQTFSGSFTPFGLMKRETEVLMRSGTLPIKFYTPPHLE